MKVLLIGNYAHDRQQSMDRFAEMLNDGLRKLGHEARILKPKPVIGRMKKGYSGISKWLGYIDKYLLFSRDLKKALKWADVVHVCDHSNAVYVSHLRNKPNVVTCHDLLAVRGGLGQDTDSPASLTGKLLQRWILSGLRKFQAIVCDSNYTRGDVEALIPASQRPRVDVVLLGLNHSYRALPPDETLRRLAAFAQLDCNRPYVLHVGSGIKRKNREGIIRIFNLTKDKWDAQLVFAGTPLTAEQKKIVSEFGLTERVLHVEPDNNQLEALYNRAAALLFPSRFEGFGWPLIEAQACGCPVLCSDRCSMPEVVSNSAIVRALDDEKGFAEALLKVIEPAERENWAQKGFENLKRFTSNEMVNAYLRIYRELIEHVKTSNIAPTLVPLR